MSIRFASIAGFVLLSSTALLADFSYEQTTRITGGMAASLARFAGKQATEPVTQTVLLKGNRLAHVSPKNADVIDLDKETFTHIDFEKKTYAVTTFQEMKQRMEEAMRSLDNKSNKGADTQERPDVSFKASVKETGQTRDLSGLTTKEFILILAMTGTDKKSGQAGTINVTNDMWMAPEIPGYDQVRAFYKRMGEKMGMMFGGTNPMGMMRPEMTKAMSEMAEEMSKMKGIPVLQVTRMGSTANGEPLPAASEAPDLSTQSQIQMPSAGEVAGNAAGSAAAGAAQSRMGRLGGLAGGLGGFGGFGRKKKEQPKEPEAAPQQEGAQGQQGALLLLETTTEYSNFSASPVDASKMEVPSGFKQVESEMGRRGRR
jgi:hypothetical protein